MKKILMSLFTVILSILIVTGCEKKENYDLNSDNNNIQEEVMEEENQSNDSVQKVKLLLSDDTTDSIEITFNTDRFAVEEYYLTEPQSAIYFIDKTNGSNYLVYVDNVEGYSIEDYYNKLVNNAKKNIKTENIQITEMEDIKYGGITFKKFSASWQEEYEYNSKETGELVQGVSDKEESVIFAELSKGSFLRYDGSIDKEILENLFVKITK